MLRTTCLLPLVLCYALRCGGAQAAAFPTTPMVGLDDDWDQLYSVMQNMMSVMDEIDQQWSSVMSNTITQIGDMAGRIVYTETLINGEAEQIGDMADRIVETEQILSNLTQNCLNCTSAAAPAPVHRAAVQPMLRLTQQHPPQKQQSHNLPTPLPPSTPSFWDEELQRVFTANLTHTLTHVGDDPVAPLLAFMNHTLEVMEQMSGNVSSEFEFLEGQVGVMADRIVGTECLIMNMSCQIGNMSDRILQTEMMMANVSSACCHVQRSPSIQHFSDGGKRPKLDSATQTSTFAGVGAGHRLGSPPPPTICNNSRGGAMPDDRNRSALSFVMPINHLRSQLHAATLQQQQRQDGREPSTQWSDSDRNQWQSFTSCSPLDPLCMAIATMTAIAQKMEDIMVHMCVQMLNETTAGALEIGKLADQIVAAEDEIIDIGGQIGRIADSIVDCERKMCQFAEHVCHAVNGTCSALTPIPSKKKPGGKHHLPTTRNVVQPMQASAETLHAIASRVHGVQEKMEQTLAQMQSYLKALPALLADAAKAASEVAVATAATAVGVRPGPESSAPDYPLQSNAMVRFPNPLKWMTLMEQLMQKMVTMSGRMLKNMGEIIQAIAGMGTKIAETSKLIFEMAGQVTQMVSRIAETVNIVDKLVKDCT